MFVRILSSSIAAASLAAAVPAFADETSVPYSQGDGITSLDLRETRSSSWIVSATAAFPDDLVLYSSGDGLSSLDRPRGGAITVQERVAIRAPAEGTQVRSAHVASSNPAAGRSLGADPFDRSMDSGG